VPTTPDTDLEETTDIDRGDADDDPVQMLLKRSDENRTTSLQQPSKMILPLLRQFRSLPRIPTNSNIIDYWESQKVVMPELYSLASVVHAAPCTEVS